MHGVASLRKLDTDNGVKCVHRVGASVMLGLKSVCPSKLHQWPIMSLVKVGTLTESSDTDSQEKPVDTGNPSVNEYLLTTEYSRSLRKVLGDLYIVLPRFCRCYAFVEYLVQ